MKEGTMGIFTLRYKLVKHIAEHIKGLFKLRNRIKTFVETFS